MNELIELRRLAEAAIKTRELLIFSEGHIDGKQLLALLNDRDQLSAEVERLKNELSSETMLVRTVDAARHALLGKNNELKQRVAELEADLAKEREIGDKLFAKLRDAEARAVPDLSKLQRYEAEIVSGVATRFVRFCEDAEGQMVALADVQALLATPPHGKDAQGGEGQSKPCRYLHFPGRLCVKCGVTPHSAAPAQGEKEKS